MLFCMNVSGLHFKPSTLKSNFWFSFLPTNLHIHSFLLTSSSYTDSLHLSRRLSPFHASGPDSATNGNGNSNGNGGGVGSLQVTLGIGLAPTDGYSVKRVASLRQPSIPFPSSSSSPSSALHPPDMPPDEVEEEESGDEEQDHRLAFTVGPDVDVASFTDYSLISLSVSPLSSGLRSTTPWRPEMTLLSDTSLPPSICTFLALNLCLSSSSPASVDLSPTTSTTSTSTTTSFYTTSNMSSLRHRNRRGILRAPSQVF
jgi:hypothetical protein